MVRFKNVAGDPGWMYGKNIAFDMPEEVGLVSAAKN